MNAYWMTAHQRPVGYQDCHASLHSFTASLNYSRFQVAWGGVGVGVGVEVGKNSRESKEGRGRGSSIPSSGLCFASEREDNHITT